MGLAVQQVEDPDLPEDPDPQAGSVYLSCPIIGMYGTSFRYT